jgi:hypothetical protein
MFGLEGVVMVGSREVPTVPTTIRAIMSAPEFALGVADARAGRPYRPGYESWDAGRQEDYERGRQWARVAPRSVTLKERGRVTAAAMRWYTRDIA